MSDDILVRIPLSGASQFHPLALAPGLPMLDARKLTYQVLLGWFGDVLAEPELSDEGVLFYVQEDGRRRPIQEKALATTADLSGPLAGEFDKLKQALFDVRPVSPSERLIFNRLQPPIGNHDGYLYRVRTETGGQRLVWCWGIQKRSSDAQAMICSSSDCALLFLRQDSSVKTCPRCEEPLSPKKSLPATRSRFPVGALAATVILGGLAAGTYWFPILTGAEESDDLPAFPDDVGELGEPGEFGEETGGETATTPAVEETIEEAVSETGTEPSTSVPVEVTPENPPGELKPEESSASTGEEKPTEPDTGTPETKQPDEGPAPVVALPEPAPATGNPRGPDSLQNQVADPGTTDPVTIPPENPAEPAESKPVGQLSWHSDYPTAYAEAANSRGRLVILFLGDRNGFPGRSRSRRSGSSARRSGSGPASR